LSDEDRASLLELARRVVAHGATSSTLLRVAPEEFSAPLQEKRAAFVSVYVDDTLRGCTGELTPGRSLVECVAHQAYAAAFHDRRFPPIETHELDRLEIQISVLSLPVPIEHESETELLESLRPHIDGLTIEAFGRKATFLPQVWESLPEPEDFLTQLKHKAGLPPQPISELRASRYQTEVFGDSESKVA
jgi:AmmeMemoRadiSam system protein A